MNKHFKILILAFVCLMVASHSSYGFNETRQRQMTELKRSLGNAQSLSDSLRISIHILDLSYRQNNENFNRFKQVLEMARRAANTDVELEMYRFISNDSRCNDSTRYAFLKRIESMPDSDIKKETALFINMCRTLRNLRECNDTVSDKTVALIEKKITEYNNIPADNIKTLHNRIAKLYEICVYLQTFAPGNVLRQNLAELENLVIQLPGLTPGIRVLVMNLSIQVHYELGDFDEVVRQANIFLDYIDSLEKSYHSSGRIYRNYDVYRYKMYRWLLACYEYLSPEQINDVYRKISNLAQLNVDIAEDIKVAGRPRVYYLMATNMYKEALDLIPSILDVTENLRHRERLVHLYSIAAEKCGTDDEQISAFSQHNECMKQIKAKKQAAADLEIRILYEGSDMHRNNTSLLSKNRELNDSNQELEIYALGGGGVIFLIVLTALFISYRRNKRMENRLKDFNKKLRAERDSLKETHTHVLAKREESNVANREKIDFFHDLSYEIMEPAKAIAGFVQLIADSFSGVRRELFDRLVAEMNENVEKLRKMVNKMIESGNAGEKANRAMDAAKQLAMDTAETDPTESPEHHRPEHNTGKSQL